MDMQAITQELERQLKNSIALGVFTSGDQEKLVQKKSELVQKLSEIELWPIDFESGKLPFVLVAESGGVGVDERVANLEWNGKPAVVKLDPLAPDDFVTIESVREPDASVYVLVNVDRGKMTLNLAPKDAMELIVKDNRSPLTISEGVAIVTHFPDFLIKNNCFSLLASRHAGDKRVPAIWINGKKQLNLGWCWNGNPHTWLGSASCEMRIG